MFVSRALLKAIGSEARRVPKPWSTHVRSWSAPGAGHSTCAPRMWRSGVVSLQIASILQHCGPNAYRACNVTQ
eukprot:scaffold256668_cov35-Tisochrysis_lutea.AAC.2